MTSHRDKMWPPDPLPLNIPRASLRRILVSCWHKLRAPTKLRDLNHRLSQARIERAVASVRGEQGARFGLPIKEQLDVIYRWHEARVQRLEEEVRTWEKRK